MPVETPTLALKDIDLVPFGVEDIDAQYCGWLNDIEVIRYLDVARQDRSVKALESYFEGVVADPNRHFFKIVVRDTLTKIGTISLGIDPIHRTAHFGYLIGERDFWGSEMALQAQVGLFDWAFEKLNLRRLWGGACTSNVGSNFNYHRLGFQREGIRRAAVFIGTEGEETSDIAEYGCLAEEWIAISAKFEKFRGA
jgi:RimJ/RimL family protein N-acetyltransferase